MSSLFRTIITSAWNALTPQRYRPAPPHSELSPFAPQSLREPLLYPTNSAADNLIARAISRTDRVTDDDIEDIVESIEPSDGTVPSHLDAQANLNILPADRFNRLEASSTRHNIADKLRFQLDEVTTLMDRGFEEDTILLYSKLDRIHIEPNYPPSFRKDFPDFPEILFAKTDEEAFIKAINLPDFHAIKAHDEFMKTGQYARENMMQGREPTYYGRRPAAIIHKQIKAYIQWAYKDAGIEEEVKNLNIPDLISVVAARQGESSDQVEERLRTKMRVRSRALRTILRVPGSPENQDPYIMPVPSVFGLAVFDNCVGLAAYDARGGPGGADMIRSIAFYRFGDKTSECWHSLSIAIAIIFARNAMGRVRDALQAAPPPPPSPPSTSNKRRRADDEAGDAASNDDDEEPRTKRPRSFLRALEPDQRNRLENEIRRRMAHERALTGVPTPPAMRGHPAVSPHSPMASQEFFSAVTRAAYGRRRPVHRPNRAARDVGGT